MNAMQATPYPHPVVREDWLAAVTEDVIEPGRPIVDPHHHLWHDRHSGRYMLEELAADLNAGHTVVATVFLQCGWQHRNDGPELFRPVGETHVVNAVAVLSESGAYGPARACAGIVGYADLRDPTIGAVLDAHVAAGGGRFRGIRQAAALDDAIVPLTSVIPPNGLLEDPDFRRGLRTLGAHGLTYDAWQYHPQLGSLLAAAQAAPDTQIVINHVGGPLGCGPYRSRHDEVFRDWLVAMTALAKCPNVFVKLGGLAMPVNGFDYHENPHPPTSERLAADWAPWMHPCIELFGADRCMFESNFPVDKGMCSYLVVWNAFKRLAAQASDAEKTSLFRTTAATFYKLAIP